MRAAEKDSEFLRVSLVCVDELTAERESLATRTAQAMVERDFLAARICELEVAAATSDEELGIVGRAMWTFRGRVATGEDRANTEDALACETIDKMSELRALVEGLNWTVSGQRARVVELVNAESICVLLVITAALSESEGTVSEAICHVYDGFPVEASSDAPAPSAER